MVIPFHKYEATGNDFIIIYDRMQKVNLSEQQIAKLCSRRFGIGADGLMLLRNEQGYDFRMIYYNADGKESSMCGNGGRCMAAYANALSIIKKKAIFVAIDGVHEGVIIKNKGAHSYVSLCMKDVENIETGNDYMLLDTGSPHYLMFVKDVEKTDVVKIGRRIRNSKRFKEKGVNVNFLEMKDNVLHVRTYERGVEDETLSCGTGVTAAALAASIKGIITKESCDIHTKGGDLKVRFTREIGNFSNIWLEGDVNFVFNGEIEF